MLGLQSSGFGADSLARFKHWQRKAFGALPTERVLRFGDAVILDDDLPHHRRWRAAGLV